MPLSFGQERLWFLDQLAPGNPFYNDGTGLRLSGRLDEAALRASLQTIVDRHEILRTVFPTVEGAPVAQALPELPVELPVRDCSPEEVADLATGEVQAPFDLAAGPNLRMRLLRTSPDDHVLLIVMHHIVFDGWSLAVFAKELAEGYRARVEGRPDDREPLSIQYADFAGWQRDRFADSVREEGLSFWSRTLAGVRDLALPTDRPRPPVPTFAGGSRVLRLSAALTKALRRLGAQEGVTAFSTLLAAYQVLLAEASGQEDVTVGTPMATRDHRDLEPLIGFFVNTVVLRGDVAGDPTFRQLMHRAQAVVMAATEHQSVPFEEVVQALAPDRSVSQNPLFQVWFTLMTDPVPEVAMPGLEVSFVDVDLKTARLDLALIMWEEGQGLTGRVEYNRDLFDEATVNRLMARLQEILQRAVTRPDLKRSELRPTPPRRPEEARRPASGSAPSTGVMSLALGLGFPFSLGIGGGGTTHCVELARHLARAGTDVTVYSVQATGLTRFPRPAVPPERSGADTVEALRAEGVRVVAVDPHPLTWRLDGRVLARAILADLPQRRLDAALAFSHEMAFLPAALGRRDVMFCGIAAASYRLWLGRANRLPAALNRALDQRFLGRPFRESRVVFANSRSTAEELVELFSVRPDRIVVNPPGVDETLAEVPPPPVEGPPRILFWGRWLKTKGIFDLLQALQPLVGRLDFRLSIGGTGNRSGLQSEIGKAGLTDRADILGELDRARLAEALAQAHLVLLPSHAESFGLAVAEAQMAGRAVVAYAAGSVPELITSGETGWLAPLGDVEALSRAVEAALSDPKRCREVGRRAQEAARDRYRWSLTAARMIEVLEKEKG